MSKNTNDPQPATAEAVEKGLAVFHVPDSRSRAYNLGAPLPLEAIVVKDIDVGNGERIFAGTVVTVIQAEIVDERDVLIGFVYGSDSGVCGIDEVQLRKSE
jgi:hypothetical protein